MTRLQIIFFLKPSVLLWTIILSGIFVSCKPQTGTKEEKTETVRTKIDKTDPVLQGDYDNYYQEELKDSDYVQYKFMPTQGNDINYTIEAYSGKTNKIFLGSKHMKIWPRKNGGYQILIGSDISMLSMTENGFFSSDGRMKMLGDTLMIDGLGLLKNDSAEPFKLIKQRE